MAPIETCPSCNGAGEIEVPWEARPGFFLPKLVTCPDCFGYGGVLTEYPTEEFAVPTWDEELPF